MKDILKLGLILLIITSVAAFALSFTNEMTKDRIAANQGAEQLQAMKEILDVADAFSEIDAALLEEIKAKYTGVSEVYEGKAQGKTVGFIVKALPNAYGGVMEVLTAITTADHKVYGVKVGQNFETPGLGTLVTETKYRDQFVGLDATSKISMVKATPDRGNNEIQAISGATVSAGAVVNGANMAREVYIQFLSTEKIEIVEELEPIDIAKELLPQTDAIDDLEQSILDEIKGKHSEVNKIFVATVDGRLTGYVVKTLTKGYGGDVEIFTAISRDGVVSGIMVGKHSETAGLGDAIEADDFRNQFKGIDAQKDIKDEVQAISGATVSSDAAIKGASVAREVYNNFLGEGKLTVKIFGDKIKDLANSFELLEANKMETIISQFPSVDEVLIAKSGNETVAYIIKAVVQGYGGPMEVYTAIKASGEIHNVALGKNSETKGLGDKVGQPDFTQKFVGLTSTEDVRGKVDTITNATVSANGFKAGVNVAVEAYNGALK